MIIRDQRVEHSNVILKYVFNLRNNKKKNGSGVECENKTKIIKTSLNTLKTFTLNRKRGNACETHVKKAMSTYQQKVSSVTIFDDIAIAFTCTCTLYTLFRCA